MTAINSIGIATNLVSSTFFNVIQASTIIVGYGIVIYVSKKIKISSIMLIGFDIILIILNHSLAMVSLALIVMMIEVFSYSNELDYRRLLRIYFSIVLSLFLVIVMMYYLFNFNNHDFSMWRNGAMIYRKALGFLQPNVASMLWISIFFSFIGLLNDRHVFIKLVAFLIPSWFLFNETQSRTSMYVLILLAMAVVLLKNRLDSQAPFLLKKATFSMPIILTTISLILLFYPTNRVIDSLLSGRITLYKTFYQQYGIHLIGQSALEEAMLDNSYLQAIMSKGILFFLVLLFIIVVLLGHKKSYTYRSLLLFMGYFLISFTETSLQHFELLLPIVLVSMIKGSDKEVHLK
ncbi:hypothetical protein [Weissella halotolerans]|nr:hypothetical protein [Weissella halotolerans]